MVILKFLLRLVVSSNSRKSWKNSLCTQDSVASSRVHSTRSLLAKLSAIVAFGTYIKVSLKRSKDADPSKPACVRSQNCGNANLRKFVDFDQRSIMQVFDYRMISEYVYFVSCVVLWNALIQKVIIIETYNLPITINDYQ